MKIKGVGSLQGKKVSNSISEILSKNEKSNGTKAKIDLVKLAGELAERKIKALNED